MIEPLVYRVAEVAALLRLSKSTVYRMIDAGEMPAVRWHRSVRVPKWWVEAKLGGKVA